MSGLGLDGILDGGLTIAALHLSAFAALGLCSTGFAGGLASRRICKLLRRRSRPANGASLAVIQGGWREYAEAHADDVERHVATLARHGEWLEEHDRKLAALFEFMTEAAEVAGISPERQDGCHLRLVVSPRRSQEGA